MNNGAFGENLPYSNLHDLNMDWIIKIAKDFLDQYTTIQEIIANGEQSLTNLTESGLEQLQNKADNLETLLQQWYDTHSQDIANQLEDALSDLNDWYTEHSAFLNQILLDKYAEFVGLADAKLAETLESIPDDYTALAQTVQELDTGITSMENSLIGNLYTTSSDVPGKYVDGDGDITAYANSQYAIFHLYDITTFSFCTGIANQPILGKMIRYDANMNVVDKVDPSTFITTNTYKGSPIYTMTVSSTIKHIVINTWVGAYDARRTFIMCKGTTITDADAESLGYSKYNNIYFADVFARLKLRQHIQELLNNTVGNLIQTGTTITDKYIDGAGDITPLVDTSYILIPLLQKSYIFVCLNIPSQVMLGRCLFLADDGTTVISTPNPADNITGNTYKYAPIYQFSIPANARYMGINTKVGVYDARTTIIANYDGIGDLANTQYSYGYLNNISFADIWARNKLLNMENSGQQILNNKLITLIGDSLTEYNYRAGTNWGMYLHDWTNCTIQNLGRSGSGFYRSDVPYSNKIPAIDPNADVIVICPSINDCMAIVSEGAILGTPSDTGSDNTVLGKANTFFAQLLTAFPATPIICFVQCPSEDYGYRLGLQPGTNYLNGIKAICESYGIPFYGDMFYKGSVLRPWNHGNRVVYFTSDNTDIGGTGVEDTIHPNSNGMKIIARRVLPLLEENIK